MLIQGYVPDIDYERSGFQLKILFICTASEPSETLIRELLEKHGVVTVRKLLAGEENYHVQAIGTDTNDVSDIADSIRNCGLEIVRSEVLDEEYTQPFDHLGKEIAEEGNRYRINRV